MKHIHKILMTLLVMGLLSAAFFGCGDYARGGNQQLTPAPSQSTITVTPTQSTGTSTVYPTTGGDNYVQPGVNLGTATPNIPAVNATNLAPISPVGTLVPIAQPTFSINSRIINPPDTVADPTLISSANDRTISFNGIIPVMTVTPLPTETVTPTSTETSTPTPTEASELLVISSSQSINPRTMNFAQFTIEKEQLVTIALNTTAGFNPPGATAWILNSSSQVIWQGDGSTPPTLAPGTYTLGVSPNYVGQAPNIIARASVAFSSGLGDALSLCMIFHSITANLQPNAHTLQGQPFSSRYDLIRGDNIINFFMIKNFQEGAIIPVALVQAASGPILIKTTLPATNVLITGTWNTATDTDTHFIKPGGQSFTSNDCYYANRTPAWFSDTTLNPNLDLDNTAGFGTTNPGYGSNFNQPEHIFCGDLSEGVYVVAYHMYAAHSIPTTIVTCQIQLNGTETFSFTNALGATDTVWLVTGLQKVSGGVVALTNVPTTFQWNRRGISAKR